MREIRLTLMTDPSERSMPQSVPTTLTIRAELECLLSGTSIFPAEVTVEIGTDGTRSFKVVGPLRRGLATAFCAAAVCSDDNVHLRMKSHRAGRVAASTSRLPI